MGILLTHPGPARRSSRLRVWSGRAYGQRRRFATCAAAVLAVGVGYHVVFGHNGLTAYRQKRQDAHALAQQLQTLTRENDSLKGHVERLTSDPGAIEHQAREELHYTRPGEIIITLPVESPSAPASTDTVKQ